MKKKKYKKNYLDSIIKRITLKLTILFLLLNFWQVGATGSYFVATANSSNNSVTAGDWVAPVTSISSLPAYTNTAIFNLAYSATDSFSGVNYLELYISKDGGPYAKYNGNYNPGDIMNFDSATTGGDGSYRFYTIGTDNATPTNIETAPAVPDAVTIIDTTNPSANAGSDQTVATGQDVTFDGSGSSDLNGIASYKWDKDASDGVNFAAPDLTGVSPTLSGGYIATGVYTVTLQVTDPAGNTSTNTLTVTITPAPHTVTVKLFPAADSRLNEANTTNNSGASNYMRVRSQSGGQNVRAILRFDTSVLPSTATVNSCKLNMYAYQATSTSRDHAAYLVSSYSGDWGEGNKTGAAADSGEVTWDWYAKPNTWLTAGGDYNPVATGSIATGTGVGWKTWDLYGDCNSRNVYSWVIKDTAEGDPAAPKADYYTKEQTGTASDPYLEIQFSAPAVTTDHLVINEVYYDVGSGKGAETTNEWVEIYNPTSGAVDISGWKICDSGSCRDIPASSSVPAWGFAVLTPDVSTWGFWPTIPIGASKIVLGGSIGGGLNNPGDQIILKNASSVEVDKMSYGTDTTIFTLPDVDEDWSLARLIKGFDTDNASDFWANNNPNPGTNPDWIPMLFIDSEEHNVSDDIVDSEVSEVEEASPSASPVPTVDLSLTPESSPSSSPAPSPEVTPTPTPDAEPTTTPTPTEPEPTPTPEPTATPTPVSTPTPTTEPEQEQSSV